VQAPSFLIGFLKAKNLDIALFDTLGPFFVGFFSNFFIIIMFTSYSNF